MSSGVFTAGIDNGGLTTDYEIRILICWLLDRLKVPVSASQLSGALLGEGMVNYFEATCAVGQLISSGHIIENEAEAGEKILVLTELGKKTSEAFYKTVPRNVRDRSLESLSQYILQERFAKENRTQIIKTEDGYRLELTLNDVGNDLMTISLYAPTKEMCEAMEKRFLLDPTRVYRMIISHLTGEKLGAIDIIDG